MVAAHALIACKQAPTIELVSFAPTIPLLSPTPNFFSFSAMPPRPKPTSRNSVAPAAEMSPAPLRDQRKKILIVDDHPFMRAGLAQLIDKQPDLQV